MASVLLIEDDAGTAVEIRWALERVGHSLRHAATGADAWAAARNGAFGAMIVDRGLPDADGLELIQNLRSAGDRTPALVLSALGDLSERVRGLQAGGDDYLSKPFALAELAARLDALIRRSSETRQTTVELGPLRLDLLSREARRGGRTLDLLPREFQLLGYLVRHAGLVVTRSMLLQDVWGYRFEPRSNVVDVHMGKLRRKVDPPDEPLLIRSVRGSGYRLDVHP